MKFHVAIRLVNTSLSSSKKKMALHETFSLAGDVVRHAYVLYVCICISFLCYYILCVNSAVKMLTFQQSYFFPGSILAGGSPLLICLHFSYPIPPKTDGGGNGMVENRTHHTRYNYTHTVLTVYRKIFCLSTYHHHHTIAFYLPTLHDSLSKKTFFLLILFLFYWNIH